MQPRAILLPYPQELEWNPGVFEAPDEGIIRISSETPQDVLPAAAELEKVLWTQMRINWEISAAKGLPQEQVRIELELSGGDNARSQLYKLEITPLLISIKSQTPAGLFYGAQTLSQLIEQFGKRIPCVQIRDWPDFEQRGVMLDISRDKVYKSETLYELIDRLAGLKINQIQLYTEHTFAYHNHPIVWKDASPLTGEDILALDRYCRERFIELVPNQNSFGHMERWLKHPQYADLAEIHGEFPVPWGTIAGPFSIAPEDPASFELVHGLFDELLPHFTSRMFNIGCDETFDLGAGKSKQACAERGIGNVYLDYLLRLNEDIRSRGFQTQFWGDILLQHPDLVERLPKDMIALEWGYEADHPFAEHGAIFAASGLAFYVCPGTSAWNTIAGRTENAIQNLLNAAENGKKFNAAGYLITDWGDSGHWQAVPISYLGYAAGAAYSWAVEANRGIEIAEAVSRTMFDDPSGTTGKVMFDLGNIYLKTGVKRSNSSLLFEILQRPAAWVKESELIDSDSLKAVAVEIERIQNEFSAERITRPDAETIRSEIQLTMRMLAHACKRGIALREAGYPGHSEELENDLREIVQEYKRLWLLRNRPGGLSDSVQKFNSMLAEYRLS